MVSPELIRRYPFFAGLEHEHIVQLARLAEEKTYQPGEYIFPETGLLEHFYLLLEGSVSIVIGVPDRSAVQPVSGQLTGKLEMKDVTISTIGTGNVFGWPALIPPHQATAGAKAIMPCKVVAFDCKQLIPKFEADPRFGYLMTLKAAQILADRLRDIRVESLAQLAG